MRLRGGCFSLQIIAAPEVNQVLPELPVLADVTKSLYDCHYDKFFVALGMHKLFTHTAMISTRNTKLANMR